MDMDPIIDDLHTAHTTHIQSLTALHESTLQSLHHSHQKTLLHLDQVTNEKTALETELEGMRREVEVLRGSFDLVQERLRRVLVEQDDLVGMVRLIEMDRVGKATGQAEQTQQPQQSQQSQQSSTQQTSKQQSQQACKQAGHHEQIAQKLKDFEAKANLKNSEQDQDSSTTAALQAIKYFKKLEASDPVHLCRLLEISFCPDRSFSLSTSLLSSISIHMASDPQNTAAFTDHPVYVILLDEIVRLKQESNELCKMVLAGSKKRKDLVAGIAKLIGEANEGTSIMKWLIDAQNEVNTGNESGIFKSFLSTFK